MANVEIPLEKFTFITDKSILDELYAERSIEVLSTEEDFLNLPTTEAYLNNTARIERVAREKAEREAADAAAAAMAGALVVEDSIPLAAVYSPAEEDECTTNTEEKDD